MGSTVVFVVHVGPPRGVGKSRSFGRKETNFRDELHECNPNHRFGLHSVNWTQKLDCIRLIERTNWIAAAAAAAAETAAAAAAAA